MPGGHSDRTPVPPRGKVASRYDVKAVPFGFDLTVEHRTLPGQDAPDESSAVLLSFLHLWNCLRMSGMSKIEILDLLDMLGAC